MAGQTLSLTIASGLQNAGFQDAANSMRGLKSEAEGLGEGLHKSVDELTNIKTLVPTIGIAELLKLVNEQALDAQENLVRLRTQVEASGLSWAKNKDQITGYIDTLSEYSRFSKEDLTQALTGLVQRTHDVAMSQRDLQLAMGLVVEAGGSLQDRIEQIGIVAQGGLPAQRAMLRLQKEFGIVATDNVDLLNKLAVTSHKALVEDMGSDMEQQAAFWNDLKEKTKEFGTDLLPTVNLLIKAARAVGTFVQDLAIGTNQLLQWTGVTTAANLIQRQFNWELEWAGKLFGTAGKEAEKSADTILKTTGRLGKQAPEDITQLTDALEKLGKKTQEMSNKGILDPQQHIKTEVAQITAELMKLPGAQAHAEAIRTAAAKFGAAERATLAAEENKKIEKVMDDLVKKTGQLDRKEMTDRKAAEKATVEEMIAEFKKLEPSTAQLQAYITQAWKYGDAQRVADTKTAVKKEAAEYAKYGKEVTTYLTAVLTNNKEAQKQALIDDVNAAASAAQGKILMYYAEGAAQEVSQKGWAGVLSGLALMAEGIAAAAAVGALASGITSSIDGGSGSTASGSGLAGSGGGGGSFGGTAGGAAAPQAQGVVVNVQGDSYGDQTLLNNMARRISDTVQSNNITFNVPAKGH